MVEFSRCPHCGRQLDPDERITYTFHWWATLLIVVIISAMLFALDLVDGELVWSTWAVLGLWLLYISVQLVRQQPYYEWLMIPISGVLFSIFLAGVDRYINPENSGMQLEWAWYAIIPIITFVVVLPIAARIARKQPTHYDRLDYLVDHLVEENS